MIKNKGTKRITSYCVFSSGCSAYL